MAQPFESSGPEEVPGRGLLRRKARGAAAREIEDLLARASRVTEVAAEQVGAIAARHRIDLGRHLSGCCRELYSRYLAHCLVDQRLSDAELADLCHLRAVLGIDESEAEEIHEDVAGTIYGDAIDSVLQDGRLDPGEERFLERLRTDLRLDAEISAQALTEARSRARQRFIAGVISTDDVLVASKGAHIELEGVSEASLEDAVAAAAAEASGALPDLAEVEITRMRAELEGGRVSRWRVSLRATLRDAH
jgi:flavin-binding protein dodecin